VFHKGTKGKFLSHAPDGKIALPQEELHANIVAGLPYLCTVMNSKRKDANEVNFYVVRVDRGLQDIDYGTIDSVDEETGRLQVRLSHPTYHIDLAQKHVQGHVSYSVETRGAGALLAEYQYGNASKPSRLSEETARRRNAPIWPFVNRPQGRIEVRPRHPRPEHKEWTPSVQEYAGYLLMADATLARVHASIVQAVGSDIVDHYAQKRVLHAQAWGTYEPVAATCRDDANLEMAITYRARQLAELQGCALDLRESECRLLAARSRNTKGPELARLLNSIDEDHAIFSYSDVLQQVTAEAGRLFDVMAGLRSKSWNVAAFDIAHGQVRLDVDQAARLLQHIALQRSLRGANSAAPLAKAVPPTPNVAPKARALPPCIAAIVAASADGSPTRPEAALASSMLRAVGFDVTQIANTLQLHPRDVDGSSPLYDCATIKRLGLCIWDCPSKDAVAEYNRRCQT
jgi:hypothetical protein